MDELIKISYENSDRPTVMGRELHKALGLKTPYHKWFARMCEYDFIENEDFIAIGQKCPTAQGNMTTFTDHQLTLSMAKEICMIQRSEIGKKCRQYFIEVERKWNSRNLNQITDSSAFENLSPQLQLLINLETKQREQEKALADIQKKLEEQETNRDEIIKATLAFGRISYSQQKEISKAVRSKAIEICRYAQTFDTVGNRIISSIYKGIQKYFDIKSYKDLCFNQLTDSFAFIADYEPEPKLLLAISQATPKPDMSFLNLLEN